MYIDVEYTVVRKLKTHGLQTSSDEQILMDCKYQVVDKNSWRQAPTAGQDIDKSSMRANSNRLAKTSSCTAINKMVGKKSLTTKHQGMRKNPRAINKHQVMGKNSWTINIK